MAVAAIPYILAAVGAAASISQSNQQRKLADYQKKVEKVNAENILAQAAANEDAQRRRSAVELGQQRASVAESGLSLNSGTGYDLTHASAVNAEMDALNIRYEGAINASNSISQSNLYKMQSKAIRSTTALNAGSAALNGYASGGGFQSKPSKITYRA
jgi:hypothetical protein